jgi:hypothetical protein
MPVSPSFVVARRVAYDFMFESLVGKPLAISSSLEVISTLLEPYFLKLSASLSWSYDIYVTLITDNN